MKWRIGLILLVPFTAVWATRIAQGDSRVGQKFVALWRGATLCSVCDLNDQVVSVPITVPHSTGTLSPAFGNVEIELTVYGDLRGPSAFVNLEIGNQATRLTPSLEGVLSGPQNGDAFKTGGLTTCQCCEGNNVATFVVTDEFFNDHLDATNHLPTRLFIPAAATFVACIQEFCTCINNFDQGFQEVRVTWTPLVACTPPDCDDGNPCTDDFCDGAIGLCEHTNVSVDLIETCYGCDDTLPRATDHVLRLIFDCDISLPGTGEPVEIRTLLAGGAFGPDIADQFDFSVEGTDVLKIVEPGEVFAHETWYGVSNASGWSGVGDFQVDYVVLHGDANNDGFTSFQDLSAINANIPTNPAPDDSRFDINADGQVSFTDLSAANAFIPSTAPGKPSGHGCFPTVGQCDDGLGESASSGGGSSGGEFVAWFPGFVSVLSAPKGREGSVEELLGDLLAWAVANLSAQERNSVADAIDDPALTFCEHLRGLEGTRDGGHAVAVKRVPIPENNQNTCTAENPFSSANADREGILGPARNLGKLLGKCTSPS